MKYAACPCGAEHLERVPRSPWMRLFASRRHYRCSRCGEHMLIAKVLAVRTGLPFALPLRDAQPNAPGAKG